MDEELLLKISILAKEIYIDVEKDFIIYLLLHNRYNTARTRIEEKIEYLEKLTRLTGNIQFEYALTKANELQDLVIDLIEREIDGERENRQIKSNTEE